MAGAKVFSKLVCNSGFHQIPLDEKSMLLTTFATPYVRFAFRRLPFDLSNASEEYQKRMHTILEGLEGVLCIINDVLVFSKNQEQHDHRLHTELERFRLAHVTLKDNSNFSQRCIKFAGHIVFDNGIDPDSDRLDAVRKMAPPINVTEMICFLGTVNQLAKFSNNIAKLVELFYDLIRESSLGAVCSKNHLMTSNKSAPFIRHY